jgi:hypothetical protein
MSQVATVIYGCILPVVVFGVGPAVAWTMTVIAARNGARGQRFP